MEDTIYLIEKDKILSYDSETGDYIDKAFAVDELMERISRILDRTDNSDQNKIEFGDSIVIDLDRHKVTVGGSKIELTLTEFKILKLLCSKPGWVFSRHKILTHLWGNDKGVLDRTVDVHIRNLRSKLGEASKYIKNMRGVGYKVEQI